MTAAGTFTHKCRDGNALETGIWLASELASFDSYGIAPGVLMKEGRVFGAPQFGPQRMPMLSGPMPTVWHPSASASCRCGEHRECFKITVKVACAGICTMDFLLPAFC